MQRVFRVVDTSELKPVGLKTTSGFNNNIRVNGVILPILLAEVPDDDGVIQLEIVDGNRRVRAAQAVRLPKLPAVVLKETTPSERSRLVLICNHLRSLNFYTESLAVSALGDSQRDVELEAKSMGLSASKIGGMMRKLEQMPQAVRAAMYEERMPVSAAMDISGFPKSLQDEIVARLEAAGRLDTRAVAAMRADWERRHGPINPRPAKRRAAPSAINAWSDPEVDHDIPLPAGPCGWEVRQSTSMPARHVPQVRATSPFDHDPVAPTRPSTSEPGFTSGATEQRVILASTNAPAPVRSVVTATADDESAATSSPAAKESEGEGAAERSAVELTLARLDAELLRLA